MEGPVVGFAGLTHLGLVSLAAAAAQGMSVVGYDLDPVRINAIKSARYSISEPGLTEALAKHEHAIEFVDEISGLNRCDFVFITLDVETVASGVSNLTELNQLIDALDDKLLSTIPLIVSSQVPPGFMRKLAERLSRKVYYQVETLIFGVALSRALYPERIMIGCSEDTLPLVPSYLAFLKRFDAPILTMRYESAELTKIAINCFLASSVSTTNMLAEICENIGADWSEIMPALRLDKRIGEFAYLSPGMGISGGNIERDIATVCRLGAEHGTETGVATSWRYNSAYRRNWALRALHQKVLTQFPSPKVSILGLSYKPNTHSIKNSPAIDLIQTLKHLPLTVYDPVVNLADNNLLFDNVVQAKSIEAVTEGADVLILMTPWQEFKVLQENLVSPSTTIQVLIDPFRFFDENVLEKSDISVISLGKSSIMTL